MRTKGYLAGALAVLAITGLTLLLQDSIEKTQEGLIYLLLISSIAVIAGTGAAVFSAVLSFFAWDFFMLPPVHRLTLDNPKDWLSLSIFLIMAVLVGGISEKMRLRQKEAALKEKGINALNRALLSVSSDTELEPAFGKLLWHAVAGSGAKGAKILLKSSGESDLVVAAEFGDLETRNRAIVHRLAQWSIDHAKAVHLGSPPEDAAREATPWPISVSDGEGNEVYLPLFTREAAEGVLIAAPHEKQPFSTADRRLLIAFSQMASMFLERRRLLKMESDAAGARETERMKSTLFSSLSHNLKTPISSLSAALANLLASQFALERPIKEQLNFMNEDLKRLTEHIENLLHLAQLESGEWTANIEPVELQEIVEIALRRLPEPEYRRVKLRFSNHLPPVLADPVQMSQALRHIVENALAYSPIDSAVEIGAKAGRRNLEIWIDDQGPGIPAEERENVFRKFYRGELALKKSIRGTGLGLSICKEIVQAHRGTIEIPDSPDGGTRFLITLPAVEQAKPAAVP